MNFAGWRCAATARTARMVRRFACCALVAACLAHVPMQAALAQSRPMYEISLENSSIEGGKLREGLRKTYALSVDGAGVKPIIVWDAQRQSRVLRFESGPTPTGRIKDRSELSIFSGIEFGKTWALAFRAKIPEGTVFTDNWQSLVQCPQAQTSTAPMSLSLLPPHQFRVVARSSDRAYRTIEEGSFPVGRWVNVEMEFMMGADGFLRLWLDGNQVANDAANFAVDGGQARCSLKIGIYRGSGTAAFAVLIDDIRLGTSREAVLLRP